MPPTTLRLTFRFLIDQSNNDTVVKHAHRLTYEEFLLKSQVYNPGQLFTRFTEMRSHDGRANSLHYKTGFAISGLIKSFGEKMPGLRDNIGQQIPFELYRFELIESDIHDRTHHMAAIYFTSPVLLLHAAIGNMLVCSLKDMLEENSNIVYTIPLQENLGISYFNEEPYIRSLI